MGFLAPLYIAAAAAVSLPVIFHLIRRMPRGRFPFGSLMFLAPSPPRLARRNRLENKLLLLLRALALTLLAVAFARPFFREPAAGAAGEMIARRIAILLDTSASMRRAGLWPEAKRRVEAVLDGIAAGDDVALYTFDSGVRIRAGFSDIIPRDPRPRQAEIRALVAGIEPTWAGTDLGAALVTVADALQDLGAAGPGEAGAVRAIVLVSDLAEGSRIDALDGFDWPPDVGTEIAAVSGADPNNAGLALAAPAAGVAEPDAGPAGVRAIIANDRESRSTEFTLRWKAAGDAGADPPPVSAHVPPGERRIVRVPLPPDGVRADRLVLEGDAQSFDNTLYRAPIIPIEVPVYYVGDDDAGGPDGLRYYVERAFPDTARRKVRVAGISAGEDLRRAPLIIAGGAPGADLIAPLRDYIREGGTLLWVLRDAGARDGIRAITGDETFEIEEVKPRDYAMLGEIRFAHPVFASFADPRYSDFTKIRFWRYRRVRVPPAGGFDVLARFEGGDPALIEAARGEGRLFILASGWSPADSQLARSTKFVPLLSAVLERAGGAEGIAAQYRVGEAVALPAGPAATGASITRPDGTRVPLTGDRRVFEGTDAPGIYRLHLAGAEHAFAVNVDVAESGTAPLAVEELERRGLRIGRAPAREEIEERRRQMRDVELEARQKSWRWLIVAALGILFLETALAGTLARRRAAEPGATT